MRFGRNLLPALWAALLLGAGCNAVRPLTPPAALTDADAAPPDAPATDVVAPEDGQPAVDSHTGEPPPDHGSADLAAIACQDDAGCTECYPATNADCTASCPAPITECDDLPQAHDPWPTVCNPLVFQDDFTDALLPQWNKLFAADDIKVVSCGLLAVDCPVHTTATLEALMPSVPPSASRLVQASLLLPGHSEPWSVTLITDPGEQPAQYARCTVERRASGLGRLQLELGYSGAVQGDETPITTLPAQLVLQTHVSGGTYHCEAYDPLTGQHWSVVASSADPGFVRSDTLLLEVINPMGNTLVTGMRLDWVRVFSN